MPVSLVCAVLEVETGFQNVFGHDAVRNPVKSPPRGLLAVTEDRYKQYLHFRRQGLGNQGVGPMQLTSPGLQDRADALGGCWKVDPNVRVGVEYLAGNIQRLGLYRGVAAYNGSTAYADKVLPLEKKWRAKLGSADAHRRRRCRPADTEGAQPAHARLRRRSAAEADQQALRRVEGRRADRRGRRVRARDAQGRAPRRLRARRPGLRLRPRDHACAALQAAPAEPPDAPRRSSARRRAGRGCASCAGPAAAASSANGSYPLGVHGPIIGTPYHGTHTRGNWQSDNALDIRIPNGTPVFALDDGVIVKTFKSPSGVTAGWQVTLRGKDNAWFYGHLTTVSVRAGERVRKGQTIGTSGSANGVPHLHIGQQVGRPRFQ